jgi:hypothetical protein
MLTVIFELDEKDLVKNYLFRTCHQKNVKTRSAPQFYVHFYYRNTPKTEDTERTEAETSDEEEDKEIRERLQCNFIHSLGTTILPVPVNLNYYTSFYDKYFAL